MDTKGKKNKFARGKTKKMMLNLWPFAKKVNPCLLYTSPSPRDRQKSRMPSSA